MGDSGPSAPSTSAIGNNYYVFLSYSHPDTRQGFTDHLYHRLVDVGLPFHPGFVFRDSDDLRIGERFSDGLLSAIDHSKISILVISEHYAGSEWCLLELIRTMKYRKNRGQIVLPVLYKVKTRDARKMKGPFGAAFHNNTRYSDEFKKEAKEALREVLELQVERLDEDYGGHEGKLVKKLVETVRCHLQRDFPAYAPVDLVGFDAHVAKVMNLADVAFLEPRIIVIHGVGGVGKTALVRTIYDKLFDKFQWHSFIKDIRETIKSKDMQYVQSLLVSDLTKSSEHAVRHSEIGIGIIQQAVEGKKVLVVLDDIDQEHLDKLIGGCNWGSGSRIFITCRDKTLPKSEYKEHGLQKLNPTYSLFLFNRHAFGMKQPSEELVALSIKIADTTEGLPLALVIVGSFLKDKDTSIWMEMLEKLKKVPHEDVQKILRISYDSLGYKEQQMFLDVACFFVGIDKRIATYLWDDLEYFSASGLEALINLSLIIDDDRNELRMHDYLRDLGRAIARPADKKLWKCSRLWGREAETIQRSKEENRNIEALRLDENGSRVFITEESFKRMPYLKFLHLSKVNFVGDFWHSLSELRWLECEECPNYFWATDVHLEKLLVLDLSGGFISEEWEGWSSIKMEKLKVLNLSRCSKLKSTPDLSGFKSLEMLILENCKNLEKIELSTEDVKCLVSLNLRGCVSLNGWSSIAMEKLKVLNLSGCFNLKSTPDLYGFKSLEMLILENCQNLEVIDPSIRDVKCLISLNLRDCRRLEKLPDPELGEMRNLEELIVDRTPIEKFPGCIGSLKKLKTLSAVGCGQLTEVPPELGEVKGLVSLNLRACRKLEHLPQRMCDLEEMKELIICMTAIKELPPLIGRLKKLEMLDASSCRSLEGLPDTIGGFKPLDGLPNSVCGLVNLTTLKLGHCYKLGKLPESIGSLVKLQQLFLNNTKLGLPNGNGNAQVENPIPDSIGKLELLTELDLSETGIEKLPDTIGHLTNLKILKIAHCVNLNTLPRTSNLSKLEELDISHCKKLGGKICVDELSSMRILDLACTLISGIGDPINELSPLEKLDLHGCEKLESLPQNISKLRSLQHLDLTRCNELQLLPELPPCLKVLKITGKQSTLPKLAHLAHLEELTVSDCPLLESLPELPSGLLKLRVDSCGKLGQLPSLSSLGSLSEFYLEGCSELTIIEGLEALKSLAKLDVSGCPKLSNLDGLKHLVALRYLAIGDSPLVNDELVQGLDRLKCLEELSIRNCTSLQIPNLPQFPHLKHLVTPACSNLVELVGLERLTTLIGLDIHDCTSFTTLPDLSCFVNLLSFLDRNTPNLHDIQGLKEGVRKSGV